jgi:hypothetical protein
MKRMRIFSVVLVISALFLSFPIHSAQGSASPPVLPPEAKVKGLTLGQWAARMNQLYTIPEPINPTVHPIPECYFVRYGNVGIAPAYFESGDSNCEMPVGMKLYVPVVLSTCASIMGDGDTEEELRACAITPTANLQASIDDIPVAHLEKYSVTSPLYTMVFPEDNILGVEAGSSSAVTFETGFFTTPLIPGLHTIHVHGEFPEYDFVYDWIYHITVTN